MTHIAIEEKLDGQSADWLEKVSEKNIKVNKSYDHMDW